MAMSLTVQSLHEVFAHGVCINDDLCPISGSHCDNQGMVVNAKTGEDQFCLIWRETYPSGLRQNIGSLPCVKERNR
jgi:hypothetical protein